VPPDTEGLHGLDVPVVVEGDLDAALALGAGGVHLPQSHDDVDRAAAAGLLLGLTVATRREAAIAEYRGAGYVQVEAVDLDTLREICMSVSIPVVVRGLDEADALGAGATGVVVDAPL
jgi:thiamine monophosphate synthase